MLKLKLTTIGTSVGVILPKEAFGGLKVDKDKGDSNFLTEERETASGLLHSTRNLRRPWSRPAR